MLLSGCVKRGSFKACEAQPGHVAAAAAPEDCEGLGGRDFGFVAPAPPLVGGVGAAAGTLPEGMYFIGVGEFMMEVTNTPHATYLAPHALRASHFALLFCSEAASFIAKLAAAAWLSR